MLALPVLSKFLDNEYVVELSSINSDYQYLFNLDRQWNI